MRDINLVRGTRFGEVKGAIEDGVLVWHNVPYGKEPSGVLRWQAPQDPEAWEGIFDASESREDALQPSEDWTGVIGTEDCLNVDIYSPEHANGLPVLVFLHGGNNQTGTSKELVGTYLAEQIQAVIVSVNHRLGLFGFNPLPALLSEANQTGNFSLLDIAKALDWVNKNIAVFGGDPENITFSGFSAGGRNVMTTLISPLFQGKYNRALVFSGGMTATSLQLSIEKTAKFLAKLVIEDNICESQEEAVSWLLCEQHRTQVREYLYSISAERLAGLLGGAGIRMSGFPHLFADGIVLPEEGFDTKNYQQVPVMMLSGTTEFSMFALGDPFLLDKQMMQYSARYRLRAALYASRFGSRMYRCFNTDDSAKQMAGHHTAPVYLGSINYGNEDSPCKIPRMGAFHGIFLGIVYPKTEAAKNVPDGTFESQAYRDMSQQFLVYLKKFIYTGDPNGKLENESSEPLDVQGKTMDRGLLLWPQWKTEDPSTLVFDGCEDHGTVTTHVYEDSMGKIIEDMERDETIPEDLKLLVNRNILNGRWFSDPVDQKYGAQNLWE